MWHGSVTSDLTNPTTSGLALSAERTIRSGRRKRLPEALVQFEIAAAGKDLCARSNAARALAVELEAMDSRRGKVANLDGTVESSGRLRGTWTAVQTGLTPGGPQAGAWTAHRVSAESEVELD